MWTTLCTQYEGSGTVLEYNAVQHYMRMAYDDYPSLEQFIIAFQQSIQKLNDLKCAPPDKWHPMNFIAALAPRWPVWAERQRSNARKPGEQPSLTSLIEDITDEARTKENSKAAGSSALYGNKPEKKDSKKKGSKDKENKPCPNCKNPKPRHKPEDCLETNTKKRKEWEQENGKKWIPYRKYIKDYESKDEEEEDSPFGLAAISRLSLSKPSLEKHLFSTPLCKTDRWLPDTGATDHITYDKAKFIDYTKMTGLDSITTVNGPIRPEGMGTIELQTILSNGTTMSIRLYNCLYMPSCPINLLSAFKLYNMGGYMKDNKLWTKDDKEIAQLDERLFIIEAEKNSAESPYLEGENGQAVSDSECSESSDEPIAYPAALEKAEPNIELWH